MTTEKRYIRIVETATGKVEKEIDVTGRLDRDIERAMLGILHQINREEYHVEDCLDMGAKP